jgi:hypothetical protein
MRNGERELVVGRPEAGGGGVEDSFSEPATSILLAKTVILSRD